MPRPDPRSKIKNALQIALLGTACVMVVGCSSFEEGPIPMAPQSLSPSQEASTYPSHGGEGDVSTYPGASDIPDAPYQSTQSYQSSYDDLWADAIKQEQAYNSQQQSHQAATDPYDNQQVYTPNAAPEPLMAQPQPTGQFPEVYSSPVTSAPYAPTVSSSPDGYNSAPARVTETSSYSGSGYGLHLASYRIEDNAYRGWQVLQREHNGALRSLGANLSQVNLPSKGAFYRLIAGPVNNRAQAAEMCEMIKIRGDYCAVTSMQGYPLVR